ncbi:MAG TPA: site-2 protease family protein [Blastocatellia bacterium]|nr:site-2 protease family protein [Blastocatellia bacterium]
MNINPGDIAIPFAVFLFSTTVHEASHAWMAYKWGDTTAKDLGRLTLNPIPHIDIFGTVIVPLLTLIQTQGGGIMGWASTPVDKSRMRDSRWGDFWTSAAGPISNLLLAIISFVLLKIVISSPGAALGDIQVPIKMLLRTGLWMNILLMILNLLPIPPLDGSHMVQNLLPDSLAEAYDKLRPFGLLLLLAVGASGLLSRLVNPVILWAMSML